jgi:hypothetical protein
LRFPALDHFPFLLLLPFCMCIRNCNILFISVTVVPSFWSGAGIQCQVVS